MNADHVNGCPARNVPDASCWCESIRDREDRAELLAALEALEASFHADDARDHYRPHHSSEENRVRARAVIAKARARGAR